MIAFPVVAADQAPAAAAAVGQRPPGDVEALWVAFPVFRAHPDGRAYPFVDVVRLDSRGLSMADVAASGLPNVPLRSEAVTSNEWILSHGVGQERVDAWLEEATRPRAVAASITTATGIKWTVLFDCSLSLFEKSQSDSAWNEALALLSSSSIGINIDRHQTADCIGPVTDATTGVAGACDMQKVAAWEEGFNRGTTAVSIFSRGTVTVPDGNQGTLAAHGYAADANVDKRLSSGESFDYCPDNKKDALRVRAPAYLPTTYVDTDFAGMSLPGITDKQVMAYWTVHELAHQFGMLHSHADCTWGGVDWGFRPHKHQTLEASSSQPKEGCIVVSPDNWQEAWQAHLHYNFSPTGESAMRAVHARWVDCVNRDWCPTGATPSAPAFVGSVSGDRTVTVEWGAPSANGGNGVQSYRVYRGTTATNGILLTGGGCSNLGNVLTCSDGGLVNGQFYYYHVRAQNGVGLGPPSSVVLGSPRVPVTVPSAPVLSVPTTGIGFVDLSWSAPANGGSAITSYNVYQGSCGGCTKSLVKSVTGTSTRISGLTGGQTYFFQVTAVNSIGESPLSNERDATPSSPGTPSAPTLTSATGGNGYVDLVWTAPTSDGGSPVTEYYIHLGTSPGNELWWDETNDLDLSFRVQGLTNGQTYYFKVTAVNVAGQGPLSNERFATPTEPSCTPNAPTSPSTSGATSSSLTISWTAPSNCSLSGYRVYRGTTSGGESTTPISSGGCAALVSSTSCTDNSGLSASTQYFYKVRAVSSTAQGSLQSPLSTEASGTTTAATCTPNAPTGPSTSGATSSSLTISWTAPTNCSLSGYRVYRGTTSGGESTTPISSGGCAALVSSTSCTDNSGLSASTQYFYKVRAVSSTAQGSLQSPLSTETSGTTTAAPCTPNAPSGVGVSNPTSSSLGVSWTGNNNGCTLSYYRVFRSTSQTGSYSEVSSSSACYRKTTTSCTDNVGLSSSTTYWYKVSAVSTTPSEGLQGGPASGSTTGTAPGAPTGVTAIASADESNYKNRITWAAPANGGSSITKYQVYRATTAGGSETLRGEPTGTSFDDLAPPTSSFYYYRVRAVNAIGTGPYSSQVTTTPFNDNFASAANAGTVQYHPDWLNTRGATTQSGELGPNCIGSATWGATVWYNFTPSASGSYTFETDGSNYDTVVQLFTGSGPTSLTRIGCDDDGGGSGTSRLTLNNLSGGTTYRLQVAGYQGAAGDLFLDIWKN